MMLSRLLDYSCIFFLLIPFGRTQDVIRKVRKVKREAGGIDVFGSTSKLSCSSYNAYSQGLQGNECKCELGKSTFLYINNTCVSNSALEEKLGITSDCQVLFQGQSDKNSPYKVFNLSEPSQNQISTFKEIQEINNSKCMVNSIIHFINDSHDRVEETNSTIAFGIDINNKSLTWRRVSPPSIFDGRILRLDTKDCVFHKLYSSNTITNPCFVFKIQGELSFSLAPSPTTSIITTIKPSAKSSLYPTTTLPTAVRTSKTVALPTRTQHATSSTLSTSAKASVATPQPSTAHPSSASPVVISKGHKDEQSGVPVGAIVGPLVGIVVIVIVIILIFLWRRRQRKATRKNGKIGNGQNRKDNPTYGKNETIDLSKQKRGPKITGNELEYDYAAVDGDPRASNGAAPGIYQSLIKDPNRESVYTPLERQEANEYNKVERAPFKPARNGPTDPTYNVLERPSDNNDEYLEPGSFIDKNKSPHSKLAPQNNEPVYNVLEGPNPEGEDEPEYNVLEDPDGQDDPEYNVLEDPDANYDNAPVERDRGHPSSHDNVGYASTVDFKQRQGNKNEPVYEAPEGPSSELTYQPLQINGQDNVYQPLDRTSRTVPDDQPVYHVLESQGSDA